MFNRIEELAESVKKDFEIKPYKIRFVFKDKSGSIIGPTEWHGVADKESIDKIASQANGIYGYHIQATDGTIFDFFFNHKTNSYHLVGVQKGERDIDVDPDLVVYESKIIRLPF
jgi:hypothetical protein